MVNATKRILGLFAPLAFLATIVWADTIPDATSVVECVNLVAVDAATYCSTPGAGGYANSLVTLQPYAGLNTNASSSGFYQGFTALATLNYSFEVLGGNTTDVVPVMFMSNLFASATENAYAFGGIVVDAAVAGNSVAVCSDGTCGAQNGTTFSQAFGVTTHPGYINTVHLQSESATGFGAGPFYASSLVDPLIYIDPSFPDAAGYSIVLSSGVANAVPSAVPEPGTFLYGVVAFSVLLLLVRSRRRTIQ